MVSASGPASVPALTSFSDTLLWDNVNQINPFLLKLLLVMMFIQAIAVKLGQPPNTKVLLAPCWDNCCIITKWMAGLEKWFSTKAVFCRDALFWPPQTLHLCAQTPKEIHTSIHYLK